jgi:O-antigen/teichoic acid export membrane protein
VGENAEHDVAEEATEAGLRRVLSASVNLVGRLGIITLLGAISTIAITRLLGPSRYGAYASAVATSALLGATADFGFSYMLSRDAGRFRGAYRSMLRAAYQVATTWSLILAIVMALLGLSAGLDTDRGIILMILAPSMVANGLNPARTFYIVLGRTSRLVLIDSGTTSIQVAASIAVAAAGLGPIAVGITVSVANIVNSVIVAAALRGMIETDRGPGALRVRFRRRTLMRRSAPLGAVAILSRMYVTIDLVLLGWLVSGPRLGDYAAAAKVLAVLASIAGTVMSGALPTLSNHVSDRRELTAIASRIWHWLAVAVLPVFVAIAVFATPIVDVAIGTQYDRAAVLIQILAAAGALGVLSNLLGSMMVALHENRALIGQNAFALLVNIAGNVLLVPRYGVAWAAWMTVLTEAIVCAGSVWTVRRAVNLAVLLSVGLRPVVAIVLGGLTGLVLLRSPAIAAVASIAAFTAAVTVLRAWPEDFTRLLLRVKRPVAEGSPN